MKTKIYFTMSLIFMVSIASHGQNYFERAFGQVSFSQLLADKFSDGSYILSGCGGLNIKTNSVGNLIYAKGIWSGGVVPSIQHYSGYSEIICAANLFSPYSSPLVKLNEQSDTIWSRTYHDTAFTQFQAEYVISHPDNYLVVQREWANLSVGKQYSIYSTDTSGSLLWSKKIWIPSSGWENYIFYRLIPSVDGGYFGIGKLMQTLSYYYYKTDSMFNLLWVKKFNSPFLPNSQGLPFMFQLNSGKLFFIAGINDTLLCNSGCLTEYIGILLSEIDTSNGAIISSQEIRTVVPIKPLTACETQDGNFIVGGEYSSGEHYALNPTQVAHHAFIVKLDPQLNVIWGDTIYDSQYRDRVEGIVAKDNRLIFSIGRYDDVNPYPFFAVTDTAASSNCLFYPIAFSNYGSVPNVYDTAFNFSGFIPANLLLTNQSLSYITSNPFPTYYCFPTDVNNNLSIPSIDISPNPSDNFLNVSIQKFENKIISIEIVNLYGQVIKKLYEGISNNHEQFQFDVSEFPSGMYFLDVNIDGRKTIKKVVKL